MIQMITIIVALISIVSSIFFPVGAWIPISITAGILLFILFGQKSKDWMHIDELSPGANEMFQRFGHYYNSPMTSRDFSSACSAIQFAPVIIGIIGAYQGYWWSLGGSVIFWFGFGPAAMAFDPTNFIQKRPELVKAHEEVIEWAASQQEQENV